MLVPWTKVVNIDRLQYTRTSLVAWKETMDKIVNIDRLQYTSTSLVAWKETMEEYSKHNPIVVH